MMCKGGPIAYLVDDRSGVTDQRILDHIVPNMVQYGIDPQVCKVLGRAVFWAVMDEAQCAKIPEHRSCQWMKAVHCQRERIW